jgi:hypothetical protein
VLGADEAVVEHARFFLRKHKNTSCPVGEAFEHGPPPYSAMILGHLERSESPSPSQDEVYRWSPDEPDAPIDTSFSTAVPVGATLL